MTDLRCFVPLVLANFARASALVFSPRGTCLMLTSTNYSITSLTLARYRCKIVSLASYSLQVCDTTKKELVKISTCWGLKSLANNNPAIHASYSAWLLDVENENDNNTSTTITILQPRYRLGFPLWGRLRYPCCLMIRRHEFYIENQQLRLGRPESFMLRNQLMIVPSKRLLLRTWCRTRVISWPIWSFSQLDPADWVFAEWAGLSWRLSGGPQSII